MAARSVSEAEIQRLVKHYTPFYASLDESEIRSEIVRAHGDQGQIQARLEELIESTAGESWVTAGGNKKPIAKPDGGRPVGVASRGGRGGGRGGKFAGPGRPQSQPVATGHENRAPNSIARGGKRSPGSKPESTNDSPVVEVAAAPATVVPKLTGWAAMAAKAPAQAPKPVAAKPVPAPKQAESAAPVAPVAPVVPQKPAQPDLTSASEFPAVVVHEPVAVVPASSSLLPARLLHLLLLLMAMVILFGARARRLFRSRRRPHPSPQRQSHHLLAHTHQLVVLSLWQ